MSNTNSYPEHDKLREITDDFQVIGEFIEWLSQNGYTICEQHKAESEPQAAKLAVEPDSCAADRLGDSFARVLQAVADSAQIYWPVNGRQPDDLLARYFGIDQERLEDEKRAMLEKLRTI